MATAHDFNGISGLLIISFFLFLQINSVPFYIEQCVNMHVDAIICFLFHSSSTNAAR